MRFEARQPDDGVNMPRESMLREFFKLTAALLLVVLGIYIVLGLALELLVPYMPKEAERALGKMLAGRWQVKGDSAGDKELKRLLDALLVNEPDFSEATVRLVKSGKANALALPGGQIIINDSLIAMIGSENELSFVLAHELGHHVHRDHLRAMGRLLVLFVMSTAVLGNDSGVSGFFVELMGKAEMKFSQRQERQADLFALDCLVARYGHAAGAVSFMQKTAERNERGRFVYYFASHPYPEDRVKFLRRRIEEKGYTTGKELPLNKVLLNAPGDGA